MSTFIATTAATATTTTTTTTATITSTTTTTTTSKAASIISTIETSYSRALSATQLIRLLDLLDTLGVICTIISNKIRITSYNPITTDPALLTLMSQILQAMGINGCIGPESIEVEYAFKNTKELEQALISLLAYFKIYIQHRETIWTLSPRSTNTISASEETLLAIEALLASLGLDLISTCDPLEHADQSQLTQIQLSKVLAVLSSFGIECIMINGLIQVVLCNPILINEPNETINAEFLNSLLALLISMGIKAELHNNTITVRSKKKFKLINNHHTLQALVLWLQSLSIRVQLTGNTILVNSSTIPENIPIGRNEIASLLESFLYSPPSLLEMQDAQEQENRSACYRIMKALGFTCEMIQNALMYINPIVLLSTLFTLALLEQPGALRNTYIVFNSIGALSILGTFISSILTRCSNTYTELFDIGTICISIINTLCTIAMSGLLWHAIQVPFRQAGFACLAVGSFSVLVSFIKILLIKMQIRKWRREASLSTGDRALTRLGLNAELTLEELQGHLPFWFNFMSWSFAFCDVNAFTSALGLMGIPGFESAQAQFSLYSMLVLLWIATRLGIIFSRRFRTIQE